MASNIFNLWGTRDTLAGSIEHYLKDSIMKHFVWLSLSLILSTAAMADALPSALADTGIIGALPNMLMIAAFFLIFYFLFIRPQNKKAKEHHQLIVNLQKGDEVVTVGGLLGKITAVSDNFFVIMIAEGVQVSVQRQAVTLTVPKGTMKSVA
jgi:preprotein translocase subunit YajC